MENGGLAVYPGSHNLGPLEDNGSLSGLLLNLKIKHFLIASFKWHRFLNNRNITL